MRRSRKPLIVLCLALACLLTASCSPNLVDWVRAMADAHNEHDVEQELLYYTDDARFEMVGKWTKTGRDQLREFLEMDALLNSHLTYTFCDTRGNTVTCRVREENDLLKAAGIDAIYYESAAHTFKNMYIDQVRVKQTQQSQRLLQKTMESFSQWASEKHARQWAELNAEGGSITKDNVGKWLALLRQWRQEMGVQEQ
jgi:hypothetical protein